MENVLSLFDYDLSQVCLREIAQPAAGVFRAIPYPYAPKVYHKWGHKVWWITLILVGATALIVLLTICFTKKPSALPRKPEDQ